MARFRLMATLVLAVALAATPTMFAGAARTSSSALPAAMPLQERIAALLNAPDLAHGFWGIEVVSLATGETLYALNPTSCSRRLPIPSFLPPLPGSL